MGNKYDKKALVQAAFEAQKRSYAPYSKFEVGAALLTDEGDIYGGCNIENASLSAGVCAERTAFLKAVYDGKRDFTAIAVVGKPKEADVFDYCAPCGICRQVLSELLTLDTPILMATKTEQKTILVRDLMPAIFGPEDLD